MGTITPRYGNPNINPSLKCEETLLTQKLVFASHSEKFTIADFLERRLWLQLSRNIYIQHKDKKKKKKKKYWPTYPTNAFLAWASVLFEY